MLKIRTLMESGTAGLTDRDLRLMLDPHMPRRAYTHDDRCGVMLYIATDFDDQNDPAVEALAEFGMSDEFITRYTDARDRGADFLMFDRDAA